MLLAFKKMDLEQLREYSENIINYVIRNMETIPEKDPKTDICEKSFKSLMSETAPSKGEPLERIMDDIEKYIMPNLNCLQHPGFHPFGQSRTFYPSVLAEMLKVTFGCVGFAWNICPSGKELERIVLDWYGRMVGLPDNFLHHKSNGGCVIQGTINESIVTCMTSSRQDYFKQLSRRRYSLSKPFIMMSLVAYCTNEAKSKFQEAISICMVILRVLDVDGYFCLQAEALSKAIEEDKAMGYIPFFVNITLGNAVGACDSLVKIGIICEKHGLWLNVDASSIGNALLCSEYRHYIEGIEYAVSFIINPCEWSMVHHDCVLLFVTDVEKISDYVMSDRTIYNYGTSPELWSSHKKKYFLSFQLWFNLRNCGTDGLKKQIRNHVQQAELFKKHMSKDKRFIILNCNLGKVYFRLIGSNAVNENLLRAINTSGKLFLRHFVLEDTLIFRFAAWLEDASEDGIKSAWHTIKEFADKVFETEGNKQG